MPRIKSEKVVIWAAISPEGNLVVSSIGAYRSSAARWAMKYRNHSVIKVGEVDRSVKQNGKKVTPAFTPIINSESTPVTVPMKRPRKVVKSIPNNNKKVAN